MKFNMFANPDVCGPTATAAMNFLGNVDAIIFDLRDNGGGDPKMVAFVSSYLFGERTHLNDCVFRRCEWSVPTRSDASKIMMPELFTSVN